ncbi:hypothetical protein [Planobispora takensis]|uniref:Uncharacterized protein n=1 Tax=Planobispora takensis TaxID=1367882 RepID=A0A8J3WRF7_9ACTN|nr:hypothetical protein [Planobispora takensis]GIH99498.1 hypothetical protein Pta02_15070 [Planobispora takensis]
MRIMDGNHKIIRTSVRARSRNGGRWRHTAEALDRLGEARRTLGLTTAYYRQRAAEETALSRTAYAAERAVTGYLDHIAAIRPSGVPAANALAARGARLLDGTDDVIKSTAHKRLMLPARRRPATGAARAENRAAPPYRTGSKDQSTAFEIEPVAPELRNEFRLHLTKSAGPTGMKRIHLR